MTDASSPPFALGEPAFRPPAGKRYICIRGGWPSCCVDMFALVWWFESGKPVPVVLAPSSTCAWTASPPRPWPLEFDTWKFPDASLNPMFEFVSQSWKVLT